MGPDEEFKPTLKNVHKMSKIFMKLATGSKTRLPEFIFVCKLPIGLWFTRDLMIIGELLLCAICLETISNPRCSNISKIHTVTLAEQRRLIALEKTNQHKNKHKTSKKQTNSFKKDGTNPSLLKSKFGRKNPLLKCNALVDQGSCRGYLGSGRGQFFRNAMRPPNLIGRTQDQSVMYCWDRKSSKVNQRSIALWPPNLVRTTPDQSVMHCYGQRPCNGDEGSSRGHLSRNA